MSEIKVEKMNRKDLDFAISMAEAEGWNPGKSDSKCFYLADPDGFYIARRDGINIGCISAVKYSDEFGFIGFYVVIPDERGSSAGVLLAKRANYHLKGCNIGLDGVLNRVENYTNLGFKYAYKNSRFEMKASSYPLDEHIIKANDAEFKDILAYDRQCFPAPRELFLKNWLSVDNMNSLVYILDNKVLGYGGIRKCLSGWKIGPLFADSIGIANKLYQGLVNFAACDTVYLDIPQINKEALELVNLYNMREVFSTARMYSHHTPNLDYNKVFGLTSFELG